MKQYRGLFLFTLTFQFLPLLLLPRGLAASLSEPQQQQQEPHQHQHQHQHQNQNQNQNQPQHPSASKELTQATPQEQKQDTSRTPLEASIPSHFNYAELCSEQLAKMPSSLKIETQSELCKKMRMAFSCKSTQDRPIYYYEKLSTKSTAKKILVLGLIHGDEGPSGTLATWWIKRLEELETTANSWRILPVTNPDGFHKTTRVNARGVDLNRNFPTQDWANSALKMWQEKTNSNPRRYPGPGPASEPETKCITEHIGDFNPDFIVAIHTPYAVLDFDGPKLKFPKFLQLPWQSLGNFPGSLGRYMWVDQKVPVLTIEMKGSLPYDPDYLLKLQDVSAQVAQMSSGAKIKIVKNP